VRASPARGMRVMACAVAVAACAACAACAAFGPERGSVVVGLTSDLTSIVRLEVEVEAGGGIEVSVVEGAGDVVSFPREVAVPTHAQPSGGGARVEVRAFRPDDLLDAPAVVRRVELEAPPPGSWLARVRLEEECIPEHRLPGDRTTPVCDAPLSCISGACASPLVPASALEPYRPDWAAEFADACKSMPAGEATLELGQGRDAFAPIAPASPLPLVLGDQGGYHLWLAVRARELHQVGTVVTLRLAAKDGSLALGEASWASALLATEEGCERAGLRFELPSEFWPPAGAALEGVVLQLEGTAVDERGDAAFAATDLTVSLARP
jgi:hypothetical protein